MNAGILYLAAVFLIPLIPTIVMFKWLKDSTAKVEGKYLGHGISFGGSIAAYYVLARFAHSILPMSEMHGASYYTLSGTMATEGPRSVDASLWSPSISARMVLPSVSPVSNGLLSYELPYDPDRPGVLTSIEFKAKNCGSVTLTLHGETATDGRRTYAIHIDRPARTISIDDTIRLSTSEPNPARADSLISLCGK